MSDFFPPLWATGLVSDVTEEFVSPLRAKFGDEVTVRFRASVEAPISEVYWCWLHNGENAKIPMVKVRTTKHWVWYEIRNTLKQSQWRWTFTVKTKSGAYYIVDRAGLSSYHKTRQNDFVLLADTQWPEWVPRGVTYQIFPDRFDRGGKNTGVKTGEYLFEGHSPQAMDWDAEPLEWKDGFCLDFFGGNLDGIRKRVGYLKDLGIQTVFLNPIFSARTTHRYDCIDYFNVDEHLGGNKALIRLVKALHEQGMKLIVDISINHCGIDHPWAQKALQDPHSEEATYFYRRKDGKLEGWLGVETLPQLNYSSKSLRKIMYEGRSSVIQKWLKPPYEIDGWRFDVGHFTGNYNQDTFGIEIFEGVRRAVKSVNPQAWIVAEHWADTVEFQQGNTWDAAMNYFASSRPLRRFLGELDRYILATEPRPVRAVHEATGFELKEQILQHYLRLPDAIGHLQMNMLDSHDHFRWHTWTEVFDWRTYCGMAFVQYVLPGTPNLYYGDEVGLGGWPQTTEGVRFPMQWDKRRWKKEFVQLYRTLNALKNSSVALQKGSMAIPYADQETVVVARFFETEVVFAVINKADRPKTVEVDVRTFGPVEVQDVFSGQKFLSANQALSLELPKKQPLLLRGHAQR